MASLDNSIREVSALGKASQAAVLSPPRATVQAVAPTLTLSVGAPVLDLVTGEIGVIQSVAVQSVTIPNT